MSCDSLYYLLESGFILKAFGTIGVLIISVVVFFLVRKSLQISPKSKELRERKMVDAEIRRLLSGVSDSLFKLNAASAHVDANDSYAVNRISHLTKVYQGLASNLVKFKLRNYGSGHSLASDSSELYEAWENIIPANLTDFFNELNAVLDQQSRSKLNKRAINEIRRKLWLAAAAFVIGIATLFAANGLFACLRPPTEGAGQWLERSAAITTVFSVLVSGLMEECLAAIRQKMDIMVGGDISKYESLQAWAIFWKGSALIMSIIGTLCWGYGSVVYAWLF